MRTMGKICGLFLFLVLVMSVSVGQNLKYVDRGPFPDTSSYPLPFGIINVGLGVDPDGKVWIQRFNASGSAADSVLADTGGYVYTRAIYVVNANGTPASFSPIQILTGPNESNVTVTDTLSGNGTSKTSGRLGYGGGIDPSTGNFVAVWATKTAQPGLLVWKIDYKTGAGVRRTLNPTGLTTNSPASAAVNDDGEVFVAGVLPDLPAIILNADLTSLGQFASSIAAFGRAIAVSGDGNDVYVPRFTGLQTYVYHSDNGSLGPYSLADSILIGASIESIALHPTTGDLWVIVDRRSDSTWTPNTAYAYNLTSKTLVDSFTIAAWDPGSTGPLPRGIAFDPSGLKVYVAHFDASAEPVVRMFQLVDLTSVEQVDPAIPAGYNLSQNFPNPFNPSTEIEFSIPEAGMTRLVVYDMLGREVRTLVNEFTAPGTYRASFWAGDFSSGTYVYVLTSGSVRLTKKMVLMK
ncbi:MAG: T9SS type A sorting domain-containing protein [Ignavibacteriales bacterium]|nr:T9SS type A sorting domain-containing protein [Ignavibacteriales bacterium]